MFRLLDQRVTSGTFESSKLRESGSGLGRVRLATQFDRGSRVAAVRQGDAVRGGERERLVE